MEILSPKRSLADQYLGSLENRFDKERFDAVIAAVRKDGVWEQTDEWRICTYITSRIERFEEKDKAWYRVSVKNGTDMSCVCPTLTRAVHYLSILEKITFDLFWVHGWSSWTEKGRLEGEQDEV